LRLALELPSNEAVRAAVEAGWAQLDLGVCSGTQPGIGTAASSAFQSAGTRFPVVRHVARCRNRAADALLSMLTAPFARFSRAP